jgi:DNA-binding MarR family transcriptional regulator
VTDGPELISSPAAQAARDLRVLIGRLRRQLKEVDSGQDQLTPSQLSVLSRLDREGASTLSTLAAAERVRPQSMAATLGALDEQGWIERNPDPDDGRRQLITLSGTAREYVHGSRQVREEWLARALQDRYTDAERRTVSEALVLLERLTRS